MADTAHYKVFYLFTWLPTYVPNPLHAFPRNFSVDGEAANLLRTCYGLVADLLATRPTSPQQVVVMEFGKRHDTPDTTEFCPRQLATDLLQTCRLRCGLVVDLLRGNWCN